MTVRSTMRSFEREITSFRKHLICTATCVMTIMLLHNHDAQLVSGRHLLSSKQAAPDPAEGKVEFELPDSTESDVTTESDDGTVDAPAGFNSMAPPPPPTSNDAKEKSVPVPKTKSAIPPPPPPEELPTDVTLEDILGPRRFPDKGSTDRVYQAMANGDQKESMIIKEQFESLLIAADKRYKKLDLKTDFLANKSITKAYLDKHKLDVTKDDLTEHFRKKKLYMIAIYFYTAATPPLFSRCNAYKRDNGNFGVYTHYAELLNEALKYLRDARIAAGLYPHLGKDRELTTYRGINLTCKCKGKDPTCACNDGRYSCRPIEGSYLSTSKLKSVAKFFMNGYIKEGADGKAVSPVKQKHRQQYVVQSHEGISIKDYSSLPDEEEVIFLPEANLGSRGVCLDKSEEDTYGEAQALLCVVGPSMKCQGGGKKSDISLDAQTTEVQKMFPFGSMVQLTRSGEIGKVMGYKSTSGVLEVGGKVTFLVDHRLRTGRCITAFKKGDTHTVKEINKRGVTLDHQHTHGSKTAKVIVPQDVLEPVSKTVLIVKWNKAHKPSDIDSIQVEQPLRCPKQEKMRQNLLLYGRTDMLKAMKKIT